ncbi:DB module [Dictyocaulus viviparus]|uniref:DB module n=1 Tax=Dictyocaulus viviparus TaxID=29172 RepID=A0A0D8Y4G9_DICVI|nr:DB module [Dictyocaulus viviparus]
MQLQLLFLFFISSAFCQQFNPFAKWESRQPTFAAPQQATALSRVQAIYGIPGQRNANQKLRTCCRQLKAADIDCRRRFCDFNALRPEMVIGFMAQCAPRGPTVGQMWDCASSRFDHRPCCRQQGVISQCLVYCETTKGVPTDYLKYIVCLGQFDKISTCFQKHLETHPNIKGDT